MTLRLYASDPLYREWDQLLTDYAALLNPACFVNLAGMDPQSAEYKADVSQWRERVAELWQELTR